MRALRLTQEAIRVLAAYKMRSFFMMAGTIIGVVALIIVMAISGGTAATLQAQVNKLGTHTIKINAGGGKGYTRPDASITTLRRDDAQALWDELQAMDEFGDNAGNPTLRLITCVAEGRGKSFRANGKQTEGNVFAVEPSWIEVMNWPMEEAIGDTISDADIATAARVVVLGTIIRDELFGDEDPIGKFVQIDQVRLRVIGVLGARGTGPSGNRSDDRVLVPLTTALNQLFEQEHLAYIRMVVYDSDKMYAIGEEARRIVHERHNIGPAEEDDFSIVTAEHILEYVRPISETGELLLYLLAGLSLLVSGIVLMNIMLISVSERTKEIGLRRAYGASGGDIFLQFLAEALTVTVCGVIIGGVIGWVVTALLPPDQVPVVISWKPFLLALTLALIVGIFFGVQPARRAAKLNPVETLK
jgi:putative ABC transport system permease protein